MRLKKSLATGLAALVLAGTTVLGGGAAMAASSSHTAFHAKSGVATSVAAKGHKHHKGKHKGQHKGKNKGTNKSQKAAA